MRNYRILIVLISLSLGPAICKPIRTKSGTTQSFHYTGIAIAVDNLIKEYEKEHQTFHEEESRDGEYLEWPDLDNKNLSNYCQKFLQHSVPTRPMENVTGSRIVKPLHYAGESTSVTNAVVMVQCRVKNSQRALSYYVTRAPFPNCVYVLKCTGNFSEFIFNIINKYCDFENKPLIICRSPKRKRTEIISKIHSTTSEPIAKDEYLLKYELEHQEMVNKSGIGGKYIKWPYAILHHNLDTYCYHYMRSCAPTRNREGVKGSWKIEKVRYQKLNTNEYIVATVVSCLPSKNNMKQRYYFTRAPETNCVYALLRQGNWVQLPLVIKFKHCDFEDPNDWQTISKSYVLKEQNIHLKTEMKEEMNIPLEFLELLPKE